MAVLYDFQCVACGHVFEHPFPGDRELRCPLCGMPVRRVYTPPAILFRPTRSNTDARVREEQENF